MSSIAAGMTCRWRRCNWSGGWCGPGGGCGSGRLVRRRHFGFDLMLDRFGALALFFLAVAAFLGGLVAFAGQLAEPFLALAQLAAAVAVGFVLAGGRPVGDLADRLERGGDDRFGRTDAAAEQRSGQQEEEHRTHIGILSNERQQSHIAPRLNRGLRRKERPPGGAVISLKQMVKTVFTIAG